MPLFISASIVSDTVDGEFNGEAIFRLDSESEIQYFPLRYVRKSLSKYLTQLFETDPGNRTLVRCTDDAFYQNIDVIDVIFGDVIDPYTGTGEPRVFMDLFDLDLIHPPIDNHGVPTICKDEEVIYTLYIVSLFDEEIPLQTPITVKYRSEEDFESIADDEACSGFTYDEIVNAVRHKYGEELGDNCLIESYGCYERYKRNVGINPVIDLDLSHLKPNGSDIDNSNTDNDSL